MITRNCFLTLLCSLLPGIQIQAFEKTLNARDGNSGQAVRFGPGVQAGLQIHNLIELK